MVNEWCSFLNYLCQLKNIYIFFEHGNQPPSFTESLCGHDHLICANLEEKLHIYAELSVMAGRSETGPEPRLLVRPSTEDIPQAGVLLSAALKEGECPLIIIVVV